MNKSSSHVAAKPTVRRTRGVIHALLNPNFLVPLIFGLSVFGFWALAPLLGYFASNAGVSEDVIAIVIRGTVVILSALVLMRVPSLPGSFMHMIPLLMFSLIYSYRMYENYFVSSYNIYIPPYVSFAMFYGSCILPGLALFSAARYLEKSEIVFQIVMFGLFSAFVVGIGLNWEQLFIQTSAQASLERVNSIALTSTAASFGIFALLHLRSPGIILRGLSITCLLSCAIIISVGKARGPILGSTVSLIFYLLFGSGLARKQLLLPLSIAAISLLALQAYSGFQIFDEMLAKFSNAEDGGAGDSVTMRKLAWQSAWEQFLDEPVIGKFMFETVYGYYPHNIALESLMATGVIGSFFLLIYLLMTFSGAVYLLRRLNIPLSNSFIVLIFCKEFTQNLFSGAIWGASGTIITSCCVLGLATAYRSRSNN